MGSGDNPSLGGTALWELGHSGLVVVLGSRVLPVALALALAWWVTRRLGPVAPSPTAMMALAAASLSLRLIFEQNLFAYYFMALVVTLVLVDVARGKIRASLVAWVTALLFVFCFDGYFEGVISGVGRARAVVPPLFLVVALCAALVGAVRRRQRSRWNVLLWLGLVVCALVTWTSSDNPFLVSLPTWFLQEVFALSGLALAMGPLLALPQGRSVLGPALHRTAGQARTFASSTGRWSGDEYAAPFRPEGRAALEESVRAG